MANIHVECRTNVLFINFTKKVSQNDEGLYFYSIKNEQFIVIKGIVIMNLKIAKKIIKFIKKNLRNSVDFSIVFFKARYHIK